MLNLQQYFLVFYVKKKDIFTTKGKLWLLTDKRFSSYFTLDMLIQSVCKLIIFMYFK